MRVKKMSLLGALLVVAAFSSTSSGDEPSLWQLQQILASKRYIDLTHEFAPGIPRNGIAHYPGWSLPALKYLYEVRKITASGHETTDTDPGIAASKDDYSLETYILGTNHYQIELLTNLYHVPEAGAIAIVSFPKPKGWLRISSACVRNRAMNFTSDATHSEGARQLHAAYTEGMIENVLGWV